MSPKSQKLNEVLVPDTVRTYELADSWCLSRKVNCIFIHGPINETIYGAVSEEYQGAIDRVVRHTDSLNYIPTIVELPDMYTGDEMSHVDVSYKDELTKRYYTELQPFLK
jgi:hypothetical protein